MSPSDAPFDPRETSNTDSGVDFPIDLAPPPVAAPPSDFNLHPAPGAYAFRFTGVGSEYFKIWAVNLALTILTIGIFSAWAKVRRLRYFYANTSIAGSSFDFHGSAAAIFRGRLIALVVAIAYYAAPRISPVLYAVVAVFILLIFPWLYWRSLRFRLGNTSYRGARFSFRGRLSGAYAILLPPATLFLGLNVLLVMFGPKNGSAPDLRFFAKLGLVYLLALAVSPYYYHRMRAYQHANAYFGATPFSYSGTAGMFYVLAGKMLLACMVPFAGSIVFGIVAAAFATRGGNPPNSMLLGAGIVICAILFYAFILLLVPYAVARSQNIVWGHTKLGEAPMSSALRARTLTKVEVVNFILTILTIGLFRPFAAVRTARTKQEAMAFHGDPARFENVMVETGGPTGAELGDLIGFDIAL